MPSADYMDLPFQEAIDYFRQKVNLPTRTWKDLWQGMHARAFVVAGAMKDDLLADLRTAVDKGISQGTTIAEFRRDFDKIIETHGWKYKGGKGWRTGVIFNTNLRTAYAAGQDKVMTDPDVLEARPYWRYVASSSREKRPEHMRWYNLVLRYDDPFWKTHRPPNGWGCKCSIVNHSAREVERLKKEEADGPHPIQTEAPKIETYEWVDKATGETHRIPKGIDPGWDYNVGEAAWGRTQALRLMDDKGPWIDIDPKGPDFYGRPMTIPADKTGKALGKRVKRGDVDGLMSAFTSAIGGDDAVFVDPAGGSTMVTQALVDHILEDPKNRWDGREAFFPLIPELMEDPFEIWVSFAVSQVSGRVAIRKKYIKVFEIADKKIVGLWAEIQNGQWVAGDLFRGKTTGAGRLRMGRLLYGRE